MAFIGMITSIAANTPHKRKIDVMGALLPSDDLFSGLTISEQTDNDQLLELEVSRAGGS